MDLTSQLAIGNPTHDPNEAWTVLSRQHPGLKCCDDGTFEYRGYRFNHFLAGLGAPNGYLLVDLDDHRLWLFTYGDPEERWSDFLAAKQLQKDRRTPIRKPTWLRWLDGLVSV